MFFPPWVYLAMAGAIGLRVALHYIDKKRVEAAARNRGLRDPKVRWAPFAPGWFFEKGERNYSVTFRDADGNPAKVTCKTSMFTGVYWRDPGH